ncbi:MAG: GntR family transcriptional regulator [Xanthobacteraceae bacterium]|jgi:DNA-binding GntR family transcriptional regulator
MSTQIQESWPIPETMVDGITERLRQAIITGAIRPRERIRVADLERKFGVSHIPIREALRRLQSEGFVEISPRRTTIAAGVDLSDLANIYDLRRIIEVEIGRRSVSRMTKSDIETVRLALVNFQAVANDPSSAEFWERHRNFHWALLAPAANPTVQRVLDHLWQSSERYVRLFVSTFATMDTVMDLHVELYEACAGGDVTTFENALTRHYVETEKTVRDGFSSLQAGRTDATDSF